MATYKEVMESNYKAMQENTDPEVQAWINDAGEWASNEKDCRCSRKYGEVWLRGLHSSSIAAPWN